jgi:hypothetical protein
MRIFRLVKYSVVALVSGAVGCVIGNGTLPEDWQKTPRALASQAQDSADALAESDSVEGALDSLRDRVSDGLRRVASYLED